MAPFTSFAQLLHHLVIDISLVDVEATPARTCDEVAATKTMIARTEQRLGLKAKRLVADTAYGTGKFLGWLIEAGITPHIPVWDKSSREDGTFSRTDFTFNSDRNLYVCPANKLLTTTGSVGADHVLRYRARKRECQVCPLKPQCCPKTPSRKVTRDLNEAARDLRDLREILRLSGVTWSTHQQWLKQHCGEHGTGEREGHQLPHAGCTGMT